MTRDEFNIESAIEDALNGLDLFAQEDLLRNVIQSAERMLEQVRDEIEESED